MVVATPSVRCELLPPPPLPHPGGASHFLDLKGREGLFPLEDGRGQDGPLRRGTSRVFPDQDISQPPSTCALPFFCVTFFRVPCIWGGVGVCVCVCV